ncbi:MAG: hypothetical protein U9P72_09175 [Campylobacterota bacterium]|nr:hypothetical protein [Campylobacterota bacterium]
MKAIRTKKFAEAIIFMKILEDESLLISDSKTTVRFFDKKNFQLLKGFKANIEHKRYKTDVISFTNNGSFFASLSSNCRETTLYNSKTKKSVAKVTRHQGEVSCSGIDPKDRYMFSCGDDGKTFVIDIKSGKLALVLPTHADTINDITFSKNAQWIATASYDRKIQLFNLATMTPSHKLRGHSYPVMKLVFLNKHRLLSIDKSNHAIIWNIHSGEILHRIQSMHDDVTQIVTAKDDRFLFVGTELGYVLVYDLETYELIDDKYIKLNSTISSMIFDEDTKELIIGTSDGELFFYDTEDGVEKLKELLEERDFDTLEFYMKINPLLVYTDIYEFISNLWDQTLEKAQLCLENNDRKKAVTLFDLFSKVPSKRTLFKNVLSEYDDFEKFTTFAKGGKIALAYGLVAQHPMYKSSSIYKSLEQRWQKTFVIAQQYALDRNTIEKAREILAPFRGISSKTMYIQELFTQGTVYQRFKDVVGKKDFKIACELVKHHPYLKEFPEYAKMINYGDKLYTKVYELIDANEINTALKMLHILHNFSNFSLEVKEIIDDISAKQQFNSAIKEDNIILAYALLDKHEDLLDTVDGKRLQEEWSDDVSVANSYAAKGDPEGIKDSLEIYMNMKSRYMSIATIFGWCYMRQLENALVKKEELKVIESGIKKYVSYFGSQNQMESFFNIFKRYHKESKMELETLTKGSLAEWRPSMIFNSILE